MGSFDRKVERNQQRMNKKGKGPNVGQGTRNSLALGANGEGDVFKGRKIMLPTVLVLVALLYVVIGLFGNTEIEEYNWVFFWVIVFSYFLVALLIFLQRPYLRVNKSCLHTMKYNRNYMLDAGDISKIRVSRNKIVIEPKMRGSKWVFSRTRNRYDIEAMAARLQQYADTYHVKVEKE